MEAAGSQEEPKKTFRKKRNKPRHRAPINKEKETVKAWWIKNDEQKNEELAPVTLSIQFFTKQPQYAIPSAPISVLSNATIKELQKLVTAYLKAGGMLKKVPPFEFIIASKILASSVGEHLTAAGVSFEAAIDVEYFERYPPPTPKDNLEHDDWVSSVMSCGQWLVTGCYDNTVQLWSIDAIEKGKGKQAHMLTIPAHNAPVKGVAWIRNQNKNIKSFVSCSIDQTAIVWDWDSAKNSVESVWECRGHTQSVECVGVELNGSRFATGSWDNTIKIWDGDTKADHQAVRDDEPDTKKSKKKTRKPKTPIVTFGGHSESVSAVKWMDNNHLLSCSWDHSIRIWDVNMKGMTSQISGNVAFFCLSYSQLNRTLLAGCADRQIRLYDPRASEGSIVRNKFSYHTKWVPSVMWSEDKENIFASGSFDSSIRVWDQRNSRGPIYNLLGHSDKVLSVDWSCPQHIASGSSDCKALVYSTT